MNELRSLFQSKLEEIQDLETTTEIPDSLLEKGKTYFSFTIQKTYKGSDFDKNYNYDINILGFIKRLQDDTENTLEIVDNKADEIENKFKELNVKCSFSDVSVLDGIRKVQVRGEVFYNEINNGLL